MKKLFDDYFTLVALVVFLVGLYSYIEFVIRKGL